MSIWAVGVVWLEVPAFKRGFGKNASNLSHAIFKDKLTAGDESSFLVKRQPL